MERSENVYKAVSYDELLSAVDPEVFPFPPSSDMLMISKSSSNQEEYHTAIKYVPPTKKTLEDHYFSHVLNNTHSTVSTSSIASQNLNLGMVIEDETKSSCCTTEAFVHYLLCCSNKTGTEDDASVFEFPVEPRNAKFPLYPPDQENREINSSVIKPYEGFHEPDEFEVQDSGILNNISFIIQMSERTKSDMGWQLEKNFNGSRSFSFGLSTIDGDSEASETDMLMTSPLPSELEYSDATFLYRVLEQKEWNKAIHRLHSHPEEAAVWIYRDAIDDESPGWRILPLHAACIFGATSHVIKAMISAYPRAANEVDMGGKLPLHLALYTCISADIVRALLAASPYTIHAPDSMGNRPITLALSSTGIARTEILQILDSGIKGDYSGRLKEYRNDHIVNAPTPAVAKSSSKKRRLGDLFRRRKEGIKG